MTTWAATCFRDELDLLEIRLATLDSVVDRHVICEAAVTHTGEAKPLVYPEHEERFKPWADKVTYIAAEGLPNDIQGREESQRRALNAPVEAEPDDLVLISDLDEIPNPAYWDSLKKVARDGGVAIPRLTMHVLGLRWCWPHTWPGGARLVTGATLANQFGGDLNVLFKTYDQDVAALWNGGANYLYGPDKAPGAGWHFSHLGGVAQVQVKLAAGLHPQFNVAPYNTAEWIGERIKDGKDLFDRRENDQVKAPKQDLPLYVQAYWDRFKHLW